MAHDAGGTESARVAALIDLINEMRDTLAAVDYAFNPELQTDPLAEVELLECYAEEPRLARLFARVNRVRLTGLDIAPLPPLSAVEGAP
jgi:hypothetical protein